ncbi:cell division protein FtsZ [candidate division CPR3 bacterium 4484_211]|uniref:Cell division protein FtsZ n=1 Tax=candidate division CPR3 bacterium 4484_211 TaxID=1968527 RepID=A0A1W9NYS2_UNCC3|nr:MAG: cell division protein FtsZ [candidate division CPR3 bacterium 4484_211]
MLIKPEIKKFARIKVVGVGGGGSNAIRNMMEAQDIQGVEFIAINTDAQALSVCPAPTKIQIGTKLTGGLGSGGNPEVGREAAEESADQIHEHLAETDMVFLTTGEGGGTGSGATPVIADIAKGEGALTVAVATKPFGFEGGRRMMVAEEGLRELKEKVDALITIPNDKLLEVVDESASLLEAFRAADEVLGRSVQGISDIIVVPGLVNRDFADVKTIMQNAGSALMGIGHSEGENRALEAAKQAIESPLLESSIHGAKGVLFNITAGENLRLSEVNKAAKMIAEAADPSANIIFGAAVDENLGEQLKITIIATGFDANKQRKEQLKKVREEIFSQDEGVETEEELEMPAFMRRK